MSKKHYELDPELQSLSYLRMPQNVFLIALSNLLVKFLYRLEKPKNGVVEKRLWIRTRDGNKIPVDFLKPSQKKSDSAMLYFPGGGYMMNGTHLHKRTLMGIVEELGCVAFMVNYRLAPKWPFPTALYDAVDVYSYISEHASELGINPKRLILGGDSAGGNLSAGTALSLLDQGKNMPIALMMIYPALVERMDTPSRQKFEDTPMLNTPLLTFISKHYYRNGVDGLHDYAFPESHPRLDELPPMFIEVAELDPLHDDGTIFASKCKALGNDVTLREVMHAPHGFDAMTKSRTVQESLLARKSFLSRFL